MLCWARGLVLHRPGRLLGAMAGVGITVSLLACLGVFIALSAATMTVRALANLPIDWQILLNSGADEQAIRDEIERVARPTALETVTYADVPGLSAESDGTVQTTGAAKVLGFGPHYRSAFPAEISMSLGSADGVLVAQQTAANLHVTVGSVITVQRIGLPPVQVKVEGVVNLPDADALFQAVGLPAGAAPQAPPDNVLLVPSELWHRLFDEQAPGRPDSARVQLHVRVARDLPTDPNAAYARAQRLANSLEARIAGSGVVGNNLAARLDHVRADALYVHVLFVFLGLPGVILAGLLTLAVAGSGAQRRQREQALLRTRGASVAVVLRLSALEAAAVGFGGIVLGLALTWIALASGLLGPALAWNGHVVWWVAGACLGGLCLAAAAVLYPAWQEARRSTVVAARAAMGRAGVPLWRRVWLDVILLLLAGFELWRVASTGYQVVLAPEGVASVSVHYEAFVGPLCLWLGGALLALRLTASGLKRGREVVSMLLRPIAGRLSATAAAALDRQRARLARGAMMAALAVSFAVSTATFNETYQFQARVDAELTNGADVSITGLSSAFPATRILAEVRKLPGVVAAQAMQHRYAYVGHDLQDIYGIDPQTLGEATHLSNAYFVGGDASATLAALAGQEDGVLVSEETVNDFQLREGDQLNLRLQRADDHVYHSVTFHFVGIAREFPTAPKDSFLVANASYLARQTGQANAETILIRASTDPAELAGRVRQLVGAAAGVKVSDIGSAQRLIGSNLTAVDLRGLTRLELSFAIVLVAGATGLVLALGLAERKRNLAILAGLGAKQRQLAAFVWSEALVVLTGGGLFGATLGFGAALALVKVLTGVFDPPPESLAIPGNYLALLALAAVAATAAAVFGMIKFSRRSVTEELRGL